MSPTAINTYLYCPRKFYLRYIKRLKTKPSIHLIRGLIVHKTIEAFHQNQPKVFRNLPVKMVSYELISIFNDKWQAAQYNLNNLSLTQDEIVFFYEDSKRMLENYSKWFCSSNWPVPKASEEKMFSKNLRVMGIVDAVYNMAEKVKLVDYKTSKKAEITDDITRQAAIYALLYEDRHGVVPESVCIHFLTEPGDPVPIRINDSVLEYGKELIEDIRNKTISMAETDYPCTCGGFCENDFI